MTRARRAVVCLGLVSLSLLFVAALNRGVAKEKTMPSPVGLKIFSAGYSFDVFMPKIQSELATSAGIAEHEQIGGSRSIQAS